MLRQCARGLSTTAVKAKGDLVQQAFVKRIRDYASQASGLIKNSSDAQKGLDDELNRLAQKFQLASADVVVKIPTNFEVCKVESSVQPLLDAGQTLDSLLASVKKETADFITARDARKKAEAAKLTIA